MNSTRKNGLITFGLIVIGINVLMLLFFALKYSDIKSPISETVLNPVSFTDPISFP